MLNYLSNAPPGQTKTTFQADLEEHFETMDAQLSQKDNLLSPLRKVLVVTVFRLGQHGYGDSDAQTHHAL